MKKVLLFFVVIIVFVSCNTNKNYLEIQIIPESSVNMKKGEIIIIFANNMKNEIKRFEEEIVPSKIIKVSIPKGSQYFAYYMSATKGVEPTVWFSGCNEELEIPEDRKVFIYANDPVILKPLEIDELSNSVKVSWEPEENADMYFLEVKYKNKFGVDIGNVNILLPSDTISFDIDEIPNLFDVQSIDIYEAVNKRLTYIEGELPVEEYNKISIRIEGMLIHSTNKMRYLTNSPMGSEYLYEVK